MMATILGKVYPALLRIRTFVRRDPYLDKRLTLW